MGASDLTTEVTEAGNGEVVDGDRGSAGGAARGNVAKKRRKQKALAVVAANGHAAKVSVRRKASNGASTAEPADADEAVPQAPEAGDAKANGNGRADSANGAVVADELPVVEELDDDLDEPSFDEELDDDVELVADEPPSEGGRRARKRAAKRGNAKKRPRGRAARRAEAARRATPAARRAALVATAASIAEAAAAAEAAPPAKKRFRRIGKFGRRLFAFVAILMIPGSVYALVVTEGPVTSLARADATYMSAQLMTADQRVRRQLARLRPRHTSAALAATREATLTTRSLALEIGDIGGADAKALQRALKLEAAWLDAVGSVLSNPRSPLRDRLVARDAALRPALVALPVPTARRKGGARHLARYATRRARRAKRS